MHQLKWIDRCIWWAFRWGKLKCNTFRRFSARSSQFGWNIDSQIDRWCTLKINSRLGLERYYRKIKFQILQHYLSKFSLQIAIGNDKHHRHLEWKFRVCKCIFFLWQIFSLGYFLSISFQSWVQVDGCRGRTYWGRRCTRLIIIDVGVDWKNCKGFWLELEVPCIEISTS